MSLNLGNKFDTSSVANMSYMFFNAGASALNPFTINLAAGDFNKLTLSNSYKNMFYYFGNGKATILVKDQARQIRIGLKERVGVDLLLLILLPYINGDG